MAPKKKTLTKIWVTMNPWFKGDAVKYDLPYFAHESLDPAIYPYQVGKPVLGAFQLKMAAQRLDKEFDSEGDSEEEGPTAHQTPNSAVTKKKNLALTGDDIDSAKKLRISGGHAATAKKVSWDMDSDDEIIVSMKEAGRTEKEIADRLASEGRIRYHSKTIGTRWARLKKAIQEHQDELMDQELTDWHEGDDDVLTQAIAKADAEIDLQKRKLDDKKWKLVSDNMKSLKPVTNFSQRACRERSDALASGTAKTPPELVENKTEDILKRIQSRVDKEQKLRGLMGVGHGHGRGRGRATAHGRDSSPPSRGPPAKKQRRGETAATTATSTTVNGTRTPGASTVYQTSTPNLPSSAASASASAFETSTDGAADLFLPAELVSTIAEGEEQLHYDTETFMMEGECESSSSSEHSLWDPRGE